jgi:carbonic anhydrase
MRRFETIWLGTSENLAKHRSSKLVVNFTPTEVAHMHHQDSCSHQPSRSAFVASGFAALAALVGAPALPALAAGPVTGPTVSAATSLRRLVAGNQRFITGNESYSDLATRRAGLVTSQAPFATILTCSDARTPPELIFNQSLGDLFVVRVAGNFVDDGGLGSMEYGYAMLHSHLVVVLGHENCGAVHATYDAIKERAKLPPHYDTFQADIGPGIAATIKAGGSLQDCVVANAKYQAAQLPIRSTILAGGVKKTDLQIIAATYLLKSGTVTFYGS